ncbi:MAG: hypothetical protein QNJ41_21925 [Xenococcaceae cyanobacterium MO_188.B32]|nr:hypothetical protein [Xenococcaceae cyanobacterium MO_188.B32]
MVFYDFYLFNRLLGIEGNYSEQKIQDYLVREIFYKKLLPELKQRGKTVIAVSHDDRYFVEADRIIKLDYGQVV